MSSAMEDYRITRENLSAFATTLLKDGYAVIVESPDGRGFAPLAEETAAVPDTTTPPTKTSFKPAVFPKSEPVFHYRKEVNDFVVQDALADGPKGVVFGARPCDAKSVGVMSKVFNWDYQDNFFNARAANLTIIGTLCQYQDEQCFCTSVGLGPASMEGSDLFLVPLADGTFGMRVVTDKGRALLDAYAQFFTAGEAEQVDAAMASVAGPERKFDAESVRTWIDGHFEDPFWNTAGETCLGCAQCAFVCPVCHCFDIVDESTTFLEGRRMKNWDACQFGLFTKHASGHNPRDGQTKRYRQRVSHKFAYYPKRFDEILCTGCGRCSRGCVVGIDIGDIAAEIGRMAG